MVNSRTIEHYSCEKCGRDFREDWESAINHELIPINYNNRYHGVIIQNGDHTHLFIYNKDRISLDHETMYVEFIMSKMQLKAPLKNKFPLIQVKESSIHEIKRLYFNREPKEENLRSGKKLWGKIKEPKYKSHFKPEIQNIINSAGNLEVKLFE